MRVDLTSTLIKNGENDVERQQDLVSQCNIDLSQKNLQEK